MRAYPHLHAEPWSKDSFLSGSVPFPSSPSLGLSLNLTTATIAAENLALHRLSASPFHGLPFALLRLGCTCGPKVDVDGIHFTGEAARFRVASRSAVLSTSMARIRTAKDHCGRALDSFSRHDPLKIVF